MSRFWRGNAAEYVFLLVLFAGCLVLFLANLGNQYLWQDEAQTALISKTILSRGVPYGYDGRNFFSQEKGAEYGDDYIWRWHTWLPFYVVAGFLSLFGQSTFVVRLPFALFAIAAVFLTYGFTRDVFRNKRIAGLAASLLALSLPFLLLSRQCRYYSMAVFFTLLSLQAYIWLLDRKRRGPVIFVIASTLLFHTHHTYLVTLFTAVVLHALLLARKRLLCLVVVVFVTALINAPALWWFSGLRYGEAYGARLSNITHIFGFTADYLGRIGRYILPWYLLLIAPLAALVRRVKGPTFLADVGTLWRNLSLPLLMVLSNVAVLAVISPQPFIRYLAPVIPMLLIVAAVLVYVAARVHWLVAAAAVAIVLLTGSFRDFLYEITHDYDGPVEGIVKYLSEHGDKDDVVAITYDDLPVKFYTDMRVVGGLTGEDLEPARNARWVIIRKYTICPQDAAVKEYLLQNVDWKSYRKIVIDYPDLPSENREEQPYHYFRTAVGEDKVVIFEKVGRAAGL